METSSILKYKIHKWSSYSANYSPENILEDRPSQQSSRWSSETNFLPQYIMLKLNEPAVVKSITFGKYDKDHVCNLKKFKVYGGLEENNLIELLQDGLKNDHIPETFALKCKMEKDQYLPCNYLKIAPILSWGPSYNFSIWYIELHGHKSKEIVQQSVQWYYKYREREAIRLCLKHFREYNYMDAFNSLERMTNVELEIPLVSKLHQQLVQIGNFVSSEQLVEQAAKDNLFKDYINEQDYDAIWSSININDDVIMKPGMRGGHQMCIDYLNDQIYIFGGWSGNNDLADFWKYDCLSNKWTCLTDDTSNCGGPTPRSCHKMCIDCHHGLIYTLGRYLDSNKRNVTSLDNQLHVYSINNNEWNLLCSDVANQGGPKLIFDHQICFDEDTNTIYVFGGRVLSPTLPPPSGDYTSRNQPPGGSDERSVTEFSGLYSYNVTSGIWKLLREDSGNAGPQDIRSRIGHSMLLDSKQRRLYIFGGQRLKEDVSDFLYYQIDKDEVSILSDGASKDSSIPPPGFTQRATIDCQLGEIYMLSGLSKDRNKREENMHNSFWVYNIKMDKWRCVYRNNQNNTNITSGSTGNHVRKTMTSHHVTSSKKLLPMTSSSVTSSGSYEKEYNEQPCPRYAHQLVYDPIKKIHYMFGGNPGKVNQSSLRLDDFWKLHLTRPQEQDVLKKCRYLIRRQRYNEMTSSNPVEALTYLSTKVYETVEHKYEKDERKYRHLASKLFGDCRHLLLHNDVTNQSDDSDSDDQIDRFVSRSLVTTSSSSSSTSSKLSCEIRANRMAVFNKLMEYFNEESRQPNQNIIDLVPF